jgi:hypothetical protein
LKAAEKWGVGGKGVRENKDVVRWTKVKYIHSGVTLRNPLKINLNINNKRTAKLIVCVTGVLVGGGRVNEGD